MEITEIKHFIEAALLAAGRPLSIDQIRNLFDPKAAPEKSELRQAIASLNDEYSGRGIEVSEVASGFRIQVNAGMADRLHKLWEEKPPRYSRALFETLALIAYRQPMTRGEIEEVRGVAVSSNIVRSLLEREWIRVVGHRDVPGRPALFGTTKLFLDYFGLKKLEDLPPLANLSDWESLRVQLNLPEVEENAVAIEAADVTTLPVRQTGTGETETGAGGADGDSDSAGVPPSPEAEAQAASEAAEALGETSATVHGFEEIVATKWPDPVKKPPEVEPQDDLTADEEVDATASGS